VNRRTTSLVIDVPHHHVTNFSKNSDQTLFQDMTCHCREKKHGPRIVRLGKKNNGSSEKMSNVDITAFRSRIREWTEIVMGERPRPRKPVEWLKDTFQMGIPIWGSTEQDTAVKLYRAAVLWWFDNYITPMISRVWQKTDVHSFLNEWQHTAWVTYVLLGQGGRLILRKLDVSGTADSLQLVINTSRNLLQHKHVRLAYALHSNVVPPAPPVAPSVPQALRGMTSPWQILPVIPPLRRKLDTWTVLQQARSAWSAWHCPADMPRCRDQWQSPNDWASPKLPCTLSMPVAQRRQLELFVLAALAACCDSLTLDCHLIVMQYVAGGVWCL
jgi:hypothetical protein